MGLDMDFCRIKTKNKEKHIDYSDVDVKEIEHILYFRKFYTLANILEETLGYYADVDYHLIDKEAREKIILRIEEILSEDNVDEPSEEEIKDYKFILQLFRAIETDLYYIGC